MDVPSSEKQGRIFYRPQLDVVRFIAFLAVFVHHVISRSGSGSVREMFADAMGFGLSLFFVLSAYLITLLLLREHRETGSIHLSAFYKRRVLRIWPLYLLGLSIGVLRALHHGVLQEQKDWFIAALLLSGNLVYPGNILMSHLWSISIEEQFYLFVPTICRSLGRRGMLMLALALILLANATLIHFSHVRADLDVRVWFNSFVQFEMFAAGILLALFDDRLPRWNATIGSCAVALAFGLWIGSAGLFHLKTMGYLAQSAAAMCTGYALVAFACCVLIVALQGLPSPRALVHGGRISYGLYVFHIPAIATVMSKIHGVAGALVSLLLTFLLAELSYRYFETPFLNLKRRFEFISTRHLHLRTPAI